MNLTRVAVAVGLAWVAATLLLKIRRVEAIDRDDGLAPFPSVDPGLPVRIRALTVPAGPAGAGFAGGA
jgi:hypothetical protein